MAAADSRAETRAASCSTLDGPRLVLAAFAVVDTVLVLCVSDAVRRDSTCAAFRALTEVGVAEGDVTSRGFTSESLELT